MLVSAFGFVAITFWVLCAVVPGLWMLLFPERAFTTKTKPRWLGLPLLSLGLYVIWLLCRH